MRLSDQGRRVDPAFWAGKRVLLTGHTGFKGGWAALWLAQMGARLTGYALPPADGPSLFALADVGRDIDNVFGDIRDQDRLAGVVAQADPEIALHFAAQPLVRHSFAAPVETFATNVMGTVHVLDALRPCRNLHAALVVTTDKVYDNEDTGRAFAEGDRLGGHDPYAASKAAAELVAASYAAAFLGPAGVPVATARGGNVIGGGDFSVDRIVPDVWRALANGEPVTLRHPDATRPWQHVLDCLAGYFLYVEALVRDGATPRALNFGPSPDTPISVATLVEAMQRALGADHGWIRDAAPRAPEKRLLALDPTLAQNALGWHERIGGAAAVQATAAWYRALAAGENMRVTTLRAIEDFVGS